jgi:hypothetical protein
MLISDGTVTILKEAKNGKIMWKLENVEMWKLEVAQSHIS